MVDPGLYALGAPDHGSPVFASANYKLSFDHLRRALAGINAWILVLDTKGINVWCAAGKGTFGTAEMVRRIHSSGLALKVGHFTIVVPQLGAPNLKAHEVCKQTGFTVEYGPVRAADIPAYLKAGRQATPKMRTMRFTFLDRLVLTPMEMNIGLGYIVPALLVFFALTGLTREGILFHRAWGAGAPLIIGAIISFLAGAMVTPLFLPVIPFRSFALKGFLVGEAGLLAYLTYGQLPLEHFLPSIIFLMVFVPGFSSFLALNFTGATTYTNPSGVKKEMKASIPVYLAAAAVSAASLITVLIQHWSS
jgi:hypothetical protein